MPLTEPHPAPIFDTGPHPEPLHSSVDVLELDEHAPDVLDLTEPEAPSPPELPARSAEPIAVPAQPTAVPGQYLQVKWWKFVLVTLGVWTAAAVVGVGLYYWWFHSVDKTWTDYTVLMYVLVCMVVALIVSMVENRPMVSATAIAVMSAPYASGCAAAALYGMYVFGWIAP
jgi:hypothetical protein